MGKKDDRLHDQTIQLIPAVRVCQQLTTLLEAAIERGQHIHEETLRELLLKARRAVRMSETLTGLDLDADTGPDLARLEPEGETPVESPDKVATQPGVRGRGSGATVDKVHTQRVRRPKGAEVEVEPDYPDEGTDIVRTVREPGDNRIWILLGLVVLIVTGLNIAISYSILDTPDEIPREATPREDAPVRAVPDELLPRQDEPARTPPPVSRRAEREDDEFVLYASDHDPSIIGDRTRVDVGYSGGWGFVFIDGEKIRTTPVLRYDLEPGPHEVEIRDVDGNTVRRWHIRMKAGRRYRLLHP